MAAAKSLRELSACYGLGEESEATDRLIGYLRLLQKWNRRINLTASTQWRDVSWLFEEALWASQFYPRGGIRHLDIGSGAGFPAVPIKIVRPSIELCLVESRAKRAVFLETVCAEMHLERVEVISRRVEEYLGEGALPPFDVISWKGIKLSAEALNRLSASTPQASLFWIFHGAELPLEDPSQADTLLSLVRRRHCSFRRGRYLSIYQRREESFT